MELHQAKPLVDEFVRFLLFQNFGLNELCFINKSKKNETNSFNYCPILLNSKCVFTNKFSN